MIFRGTRSAGYGFVSVATAEAAQKAVEVLDKQELDGRQVIVEVAKPAEQKDKEKKAKKASKRRPGRRGSKSVPGEVSEAEANGTANGDAEKAEGAASATEGEKPKKKKKSSVRCVFICWCEHVVDVTRSASRRRPRRPRLKVVKGQRRMPRPLRERQLLRSPAHASLRPPGLSALLVRILMGSRPRASCSSRTLASTSTTPVSRPCSRTPASP